MLFVAYHTDTTTFQTDANILPAWEPILLFWSSVSFFFVVSVTCLQLGDISDKDNIFLGTVNGFVFFILQADMIVRNKFTHEQMFEHSSAAWKPPFTVFSLPLTLAPVLILYPRTIVRDSFEIYLKFTRASNH